MAHHTKWSNLSDAELLNQLAESRGRSPVIDELCNRLEQYADNEVVSSDADSSVECPVCEAPLTASYIADDAKFRVSV